MKTQKLMLDTMQYIVQMFESIKRKKYCYYLSDFEHAREIELFISIFSYAQEKGISFVHANVLTIFLTWDKYVLLIQYDYYRDQIVVEQSKYDRISPNRYVDFAQFYIDQHYNDFLDPIAKPPKEIDKRFVGIL